MKRCILIMASLLIFLTGCQAQKKAEDAAPAPEAGKTTESPSTPEAGKKTEPASAPEKSRKEIAAERQKFAKRMQELGYEAPPRAIVTAKITSQNDRLSHVDAERSYAFSKPAIQRCYMDALTFEYMLQGDVKMMISRTNAQEAEISEFTSTIKTNDFESCIQKAARTWRLPEGAKIEVSLNFTSKPAPTAEELREQFHHDQLLNHEHEGEEAHEAEAPAEPAE